jgi:uncharacterized protein (TIGR02757 family)
VTAPRPAPTAKKTVTAKDRRDAQARAHQNHLRRVLDAVRARPDLRERRAFDPVDVVHRYASVFDREIVALVAASVAFGNVTAIRAKLEDALARFGPSPASAADDEAELLRKMAGWVHRVYLGEDIARLALGARRVQKTHGGLGVYFSTELSRGVPLREALARFCDAIRVAGGLPLPGSNRADRRGPMHLLPDPRGASSSKRLLLFLRWMVRPADGIDLGLWPIDPQVLLCPVDTHIHKLAKNLGWTRRQDLSWRTAEEITAALRQLDPADPVKYDFSLCHLGMVQRCPSRRDEGRCEGCGVKPVCRHWSK